MDKDASDEDSAAEGQYHIECLQDLWNILRNESAQLDMSSISENMTILLGNTRAGKSTLRMLLSSTNNFENLRAVDEPSRIEDIGGTAIGTSSGYSCTSAPKIFQVANTQDITFVDMPGGNDNRGAFQEIVGIHLLNQVVNKAKMLKFLVVVPFQAFYNDGNREDRTRPYVFVSQIVHHVSTPTCVGLVVTKIDNHEPWNNDYLVKAKILSSLKALKLQIKRTSNTNETHDQNTLVITSLIERKSIFLIRRPRKPVGVKSMPIAHVLDPRTEKSYYQDMRQKFVQFSGELEAAQKISLFTAIPSDTTKYWLTQKIYPNVSNQISEETNHLLAGFYGIAKQQVKSLSTDKTGRVVIFSRLADVQEKITLFLNKSEEYYNQPSYFIKQLADVFNMDYRQLKLGTLTAVEKQFSYLQSITGIVYAGRSPNISSFRNHMKTLYETLMIENKPNLKSDLEEWLTDEIDNHLSIIKTKYTERFQVWTGRMDNFSFVAKRLDMHLEGLSMLMENNAEPTPITLLYDILNLVASKQEKDSFHQLTLSNKNFCQVGGSAEINNGLIRQVHNFLQSLRNTMRLNLESTPDLRNTFQGNFSTVVNSVKRSFFKETYMNFRSADIPNLIPKLKQLKQNVKTYQEQVNQRSSQPSNLLNELCELFKCLYLCSGDFLQFEYEDWKNEDLSDALHLSWHKFVSELYHHFESLIKIYRFMHHIFLSCGKSIEIIHKLKTMQPNSIAANQLTTLVAEIDTCLEEYTQDITNELVTEFFTSDLFLEERKLFAKLIQILAAIPTSFCLGSTILIMSQTNIVLSDVTDKNGQLNILGSSNSEQEYVIFLTNGTFFVDTNFIARNGNVKNLLIICSQVKCVGARIIQLDGENGRSFEFSASNGSTWGEEGNDGLDGENGGSGGNIYLLTHKLIDAPTLKLVTKGGDGGKGQDGGNGYIGYNHPQITIHFCKKMRTYFTEHDELLTQFCKAIGFHLPNLDELQLKLQDIDKTPNQQIFHKTKSRVQYSLATAVTLRFIANIPNIEFAEEFPCLCSDLLVLANFCNISNSADDVVGHILEANHFSCPSTNKEICPVIFYMNTVGRLTLRKVWDEKEELVLTPSKELKALYDKVGCFEDGTTDYLLTIIIKANNLLLDVCKLVAGEEGLENFSKTQSDRASNLAGEVCSPEKHILKNVWPFQHVSDSIKIEMKGQLGGKGGHGGNMGCPGNIKYLTSSHDHLGCALKAHHGVPGKSGADGSRGRNGEAFFKNKQRKMEEEEFVLIPNEELYPSKPTCTGQCKNISPTCDSDIANHLRTCLTKVAQAPKRLIISILSQHDWTMRQMFNTKMFVDEYRSLSAKAFGYGPRSLHENSSLHLSAETEYRERLEKFRNLNTFETGEAYAIKSTLHCISYKMASLKLHHQSSPPIILNLADYLKASLLTLDSYQKAEITSQISDNHSSFNQTIDSRILQKKKTMNEAISSYMANIEEWFHDQQQQCKEDLAGLIRVLEVREQYQKAADICNGIGFFLSFVGTNCVGVIGNLCAGTILKASSALAWLVTEITPAPMNTPNGMKSHDWVDTTRIKRESEKRVDRQISILEAAIKERPALSKIFSVQLDNLKGLKSSLGTCSVTNIDIKDTVMGTNNAFRKCLLDLEQIRSQLFDILNTKRTTFGDNHPLARVLDTLYFDLVTDEATWEEYTRTKGSFMDAAKNREIAIEERFVPALDGILAKVKQDLQGNTGLEMSKWKLKDLILEMKNYLKTFMEGLPSIRELEIGFKKIDLLLEMHISMWDDIEKENEKKEMSSFIARGSGIIDQFGNAEIDSSLKNNVIQIMFLTRAQLLFQEYKRIERAFLQWAFPYAKKYMEAVENELVDIRAVCSGGDIGEDGIKDAATKCNKVVEYFMEIYHKSLAQTTSEDVAWCTHYFSGNSENPPLYEWSHETHWEQIRRLLLGYPTKFLADVRKCPLGKGAIKVNKSIELRFCFTNRSSTDYQEEIDNHLRNLIIEMTHSGDSHYKVDSEYFCIRGEEMCLIGNVQTTASDNKLTENDSRAKIIDYVLSPFTEWTFKLRLANPDPSKDQQSFFAQLADKFSHCVDLQLVGQGRFLDEYGDTWVKKRPQNVCDYYEKVETNVNTDDFEDIGRNEQNMTEKPFLLSNKINMPFREEDNSFDSNNNPMMNKIGLPNIGNSCYMNSIIQCLGHTTNLVDHFLSQSNLNYSLQSKGELTEVLTKTFVQIHSTGDTVDSLLHLKNSIGKKHAHFLGSEQQDAHEFLTILLSILHEEMNTASFETALEVETTTSLPEYLDATHAWNEYKKLHCSKIMEFFCGQQKSQIVCNECKGISVNFEPFFILSIPLPTQRHQKINLRACIDDFLAEEKVSGWDCSNCTRKINATKNSCFCRVPPYLILHLKRFQFNEHSVTKLNDIVYHVDELVLTTEEEILGNKNTANHVYRLYAVTNHYGSIERGHYTAFCRDTEDGSWWKFNDNKVHQLETQQFSAEAAYILFYQLKC